jgi:hypothetical protein
VATQKVDWNKAYTWFIEDATRSYMDVAKKFNVTKRAVERQAAKVSPDGSKTTWAMRRRLLGEKADKKTEQDHKKSAVARNEQHLMQYRNLQIVISSLIAEIAQQGKVLIDPTTGERIRVSSVDASQLASLARALKTAIDGERVIMGLSTSVSAVKPESEDGFGKGWGDLLALAVDRTKDI